MWNPTPNFKVALLVLALVASLVFGLTARAAEAPPSDALVITQCDAVVVIFFHLPDGTVEKVVPTPDNVGAIRDLLRVTEHVRVLVADCEAVGHDSVR